jgi:hypothetical protein
MTTMQGMLAQTIQQDRTRAFTDPSRLSRIQATRSTTTVPSLRKLLTGSIIRRERRAALGSILARSAA